MFMGEFHHTIDSKGRIIIPSKFRQEIGESFVVTRGMDGCLFCYPMDQWKQLEAQLDKLPLTKKDARAFTRFFYSAAMEVEFDKQGRINLSAPLIKFSELQKNCVIVGVSDRIEIWDEEKWTKFSEEAEENFEDISEKMTDFDF
ncbi:division/cell wall cluster transcriptional repressor MraZ [Companilactobacillus sp.]|uniref:division/cell wall cluster transcriptional repressor MraZ n=1 Tax=Companilactobacillus sp. TaxID=2767905 RepID=UPI0025C0F96F|nr:division/cell wall cluster transcriptional repressor MraZ [Companilactobacillus sp.]MCH4008452.1 division/cell wall cluster transcriptional repressor MraZ [Companilactobacillus sp.]MCH4051369.1 division/cell wall cluster transcriptional repressor MraZ [Companilactobacillus sp.]MCH4076395.1 division/cell wall cluster transcriptional repressor MraZ [Companilactobacillus sp.]MCH4124970.1 division/cell wall cluster transcriptional repressor MraZ [Companilactobacillus sp.]MCH4131512.1 division/c